MRTWILVAVLVTSAGTGYAKDKEASCGLSDVDEMREAVSLTATNEGNASSRRSALLRWWRLMWRQGQDMQAFDEVAAHLLNTSPKSASNWWAVDRGFAVLEEMLRNPVFIEQKTGEASGGLSAATDWPYYMGPTGRNSGYSPDSGPSEGVIDWRFPKGYAWKAVPVVEDGKVYLSSPGIDVAGYCLDESSGQILWRARQFGEKFYGTPVSKFDPVVSGDRVLIRSGASGSRIRAFDKQTGRALGRASAGGQTGKRSHLAYVRAERDIVLGDARTGRDVWSYKTGTKMAGEPQLDSGSLYAASETGTVFKFDEKSSEPVWRVQLGDQIRGKLAVGAAAIYAGGKDSVLHALDKKTGSVLWRYDTGNPQPRANQYFSAPLEMGNRLYFGTAASEVCCLDARDGTLIWKHRVDDWARARPVKVGDTVYVATLGSRLYALKEGAAGVEESWVRFLGVHGVIADLVAGPQGLLVSARDLMVYSVSYDVGKVRWRHGILDGAWIGGRFIQADYTAYLPGSPTVADGVVYVGGPDGFVNAIDAETGREIWKFEVSGTVSAAVSLIDGKAFFGQEGILFSDLGEDGEESSQEDGAQYFAVDQKTGLPVWSSREFGLVWVAPVYNDGVMFLGDMKGYVYGLDPDTGETLWRYYTAANTPQEDRPHDQHVHGWPPGVYCLPALDEECFYTGSWSGYYFAFEQKTGALRWRAQTGNPDGGGGLPDSAAPTLHKDHLYVQKGGNRIAAIDIRSGEIDWEWTAELGFLQNGTLAGLGDKVYGSEARRVTHIPYISRIHCFADVESGSELLWSHGDGGGLTAPVVTDSQLMFGSSTGMFLTSLDPQTGELKWRVYTGGEMTENVPAIYGNRLFSVSQNGWLNAVK